MNGLLDERRTSQAWVDHSTLKGEPAGTDTRYTIELTGLVDDQWTEAFRITQAESTGYRRFRLDRANRTISFSCRIVDGPAQVFEVLDQLELLLGLVNQQTEARREARVRLAP